MPVHKYKSFEEAEKAVLNSDPGTSLRRLSQLWDMIDALNPERPPYPRGIFKFKTLAEANRHMEETMLARALQIQKKLRADKNVSR
ncbi:hypothetical protein D6833_09280 [Candidatus Parcubacteria bacterium]|nr:MAG: hypothetical protein D6833_09280 [Candidatus Parcubacteria bacterium]